MGLSTQGSSEAMNIHLRICLACAHSHGRGGGGGIVLNFHGVRVMNVQAANVDFSLDLSPTC